jgi:CheY-like chemotaxis protein
MAHVMTVDDNEGVQAFLRAALSGAGHTTISAQHGREALALLTESPRRPQIVVTDLDMPIMNGAFFLASCRERYPDIPVVVFSGEQNARLVAPDAQGYLLKSRSAGIELLAMIEQLLASPSPSSVARVVSRHASAEAYRLVRYLNSAPATRSYGGLFSVQETESANERSVVVTAPSAAHTAVLTGYALAHQEWLERVSPSDRD